MSCLSHETLRIYSHKESVPNISMKFLVTLFLIFQLLTSESNDALSKSQLKATNHMKYLSTN